MFLPNKAKRRI